MPRFSANISTLFTERPFLDRLAAARDAGFRAVEMQFPYAVDLADLVKAKEDAGVRVVLINAPPGDWEAGERGLAALPGREDAFRDSMALARRTAVALSCPAVHVMAGIVTGEDEAAWFEVLTRNLAAAAAAFAEDGVRVLVEPLNGRDVPGYALQTSADAIAAMDRAGHPNMALQFDVYHAATMGEEPVAALRRLLPRIGHVQFADVPGRGEPGSGKIDFPALFAALDEMGYDGWVGAEYTPTARTEETLGWLHP